MPGIYRRTSEKSRLVRSGSAERLAPHSTRQGRSTRELLSANGINVVSKFGEDRV